VFINLLLIIQMNAMLDQRLKNGTSGLQIINLVIKKRSGVQKLTEFINMYGIESIVMVLIKEYEVVDKYRLHAYEQ
jgi:hypothetical protein